jgi:hypothetical protein
MECSGVRFTRQNRRSGAMILGLVGKPATYRGEPNALGVSLETIPLPSHRKRKTHGSGVSSKKNWCRRGDSNPQARSGTRP